MQQPDYLDLDQIIERNPHVDKSTIERSEQVRKQLAEVGIELGGYHLTPGLYTTSHECTNKGTL